MKPHLSVVEPRNENRQVRPMPQRQANAKLRTREYLMPAEVEKMVKAAKDGRWGHRDATLSSLPIAMACAPRRSVTSNGRRSSSVDRRPYMCGGPKAASRRSIQSAATSCAC